MSVQSEINRISGNVTAALEAIAAKGVSVGSGSNSDDLAALIAAIQKGVILPALTSEGAAADLLTGKQLIDSDGNIVNGGMPSVTQATPSISVNTSGLITASATQSAGKVAAGTKSATKQLTVQAAQTITPGTSDKTIASGRYLTGTQTIKGDANLIAENIKSGVSIFDVLGTLEAGGGSDGGVTYTTGTFKPSSSTTYMDITHGLGTIPKIVLFVYDGTSTVKGSYLYGLHADGKSGAIWVTTASVSVYGRRNNTWDITSSGSTAASYLQSSLVASDATAETMRIGNVGGEAYTSTSLGFIAGSTYKWIAVA